MCAWCLENKGMYLFRWQSGMEDGETKRMLRRMQMLQDAREYLANHLSNKSITILI